MKTHNNNQYINKKFKILKMNLNKLLKKLKIKINKYHNHIFYLSYKIYTKKISKSFN